MAALSPHGPLAGLRGILAACHPEPAALVTLLTALLALSAGRGPGTLWVAAAVGAGQLSVGWTNDYLDRDLDRRQGRRDKPLAAEPPRSGRAQAAPLSAASVRTAAICAGVACVPLSLAVTAGFAAAHLAAVACAMAYNAGLKTRPVSVVPYAVAFGLLPAAVTLGLPLPRWPPVWAVAAGALMGAGGHLTQALPDIPADRRDGIRGLPQLLGQRASAAAAAVLVLVANATIVAGSGPGARGGSLAGGLRVAGLAVVTALAAAVLAAALAGRPRLAFRLMLGAAALTVLALLGGGHSL